MPDVSEGYAPGPGGYYKLSDRSGPYAISAGGIATLLSDATAQGVATYRGGTITTGGTSQVLMAANSARRGFTVQNQSTGDLYIKIGGAAAALNNTSLRIAPGVLYESPTHHVSTGAIAIIGATTGQAWYGTEF